MRYHVRVASKPRVKASTMRGALCAESSDQFPASAGVTVNETASDVSVATTTTSPNSERKRPVTPGKKEIGKNTTTSTSVMTMAAAPISVRPSRAAVFGASPFSKCRFAFSKTTIESSTRIPMHSVIASSEIVSIVKFARRITKSVVSKDVGIAIITTIALRHERRKNSITIPVKMMPSAIV